MNKYTPSPQSESSKTLIILFVVAIIALAIFVFFFTGHYSVDTTTRFSLWGMLAVLVLLVSVTYAMSPRGVSADDEALYICLRLGKKRIAKDEITKIQAYSQGEHAIRIMGNGGLWGYVGIFSNSKLGKFTCYVTDFNHSYVIYRKNKRPIVVSVADPSVLA